jgi:preprotein translocase subunit SecG
MAASFGGASSSADQVLGARQAGNFLSATSWWAGGIFLFLCFVLAMMSSRNRVPQSVLDQPSNVPVPAATSPAPSSAAPVVPLQQAPASSPTTTTPPATRP